VQSRHGSGRDQASTAVIHDPEAHPETMESPPTPLCERGVGGIFVAEGAENAENKAAVPSAVSAISAVKNKATGLPE